MVRGVIDGVVDQPQGQLANHQMAREMVGEADQPQAKKHKHTENTDNVAENAEDTVNATENIAKRVEPYGYAVIYVGQVINGTEGSCLCAYFLDLAELSITMDLDPALQNLIAILKSDIDRQSGVPPSVRGFPVRGFDIPRLDDVEHVCGSSRQVGAPLSSQ